MFTASVYYASSSLGRYSIPQHAACLIMAFYMADTLTTFAISLNSELQIYQ